MYQRRQIRSVPTRSEVMVESRRGTVEKAVVTDESVDGGIGLLFTSDPRLAVDDMITVWYRSAPTKAVVPELITD